MVDPTYTPLNLLRQYFVDRKEIIEKDEQIIFGNISCHKNSKTNCLIFRSGSNGIPKQYYTLECLLYILKNIRKPHPLYVREAAEANIQAVKRPDRKALLAYLTGETTKCPCIDTFATVEIPTLEATKYKQYENTFKEPWPEEPHQKRSKNDLHVLKASTASSDRPLTEALSLEKIAAIRAKRLAKLVGKQ